MIGGRGQTHAAVKVSSLVRALEQGRWPAHEHRPEPLLIHCATREISIWRLSCTHCAARCSGISTEQVEI